MKNLILETATEKGCILLEKEGKIISHLLLPGGPLLSRTLAQEVSSLLTKHSFIPEKIAVGQGPGSFTGIRVGVSLAKALSFGWNIPLVGFCSLKAFAPEEHLTPVVFDAKMGGIYLWIPGEKPTLCPIETLQTLKHFSSPHPTTLLKRISFQGTFQETSPNPAHLIHLARENSALDIEYLDLKGFAPLS